MHDELGRPLHLAAPPRRIVSLVPSLTEFLVDIAGPERLVGRTTYCIAPAAAVATIPALGGTKNPDRAGIIAAQPDLVIASKEENRKPDIEALAAAGLAVYVTDVVSVAGARRTLATLAELVGCAVEAAPMLQELDGVLAGPPPTRTVVAAIWRDPWMVVGSETYADDLLRCCGAINLGATLAGRYPRLDLAAIKALGPELLLLPDEPYAFGPEDQAECVDVAQQVALCDGTALTWYGSRMAQGIVALRQLIAA